MAIPTTSPTRAPTALRRSRINASVSPIATGSNHQERGTVRRSSYMPPLWSPLRPHGGRHPRARTGYRSVGLGTVTGSVAPASPSERPAPPLPLSPTTPPPGAVLPPRAPEAPAPGTRLGSHYEHCFGCGPEHPGGLRIDAVAGQGLDVTAEFAVRSAHQGGPGLAHGGLLTTAMDETLGALNWLLHAPAVTGRLETDFVRPVPVDSVLHLRAWITGVHGRKIYSAA